MRCMSFYILISLCLASNGTIFREISRYGFKTVRSLTGASIVVLSRRMLKFKATQPFHHSISRIRVYLRSGVKKSYHMVNRDPVTTSRNGFMVPVILCSPGQHPEGNYHEISMCNYRPSVAKIPVLDTDHFWQSDIFLTLYTLNYYMQRRTWVAIICIRLCQILGNCLVMYY